MPGRVWQCHCFLFNLRMMDLNWWVRAADLTLLFYALLLVALAIWAFLGRLPKAVSSKYARRVVHQSQLPFTYSWRHVITIEDLPLFERARVRHLVLFLAVCFLSLVILSHSYINVVVMLSDCNRRRLGL